MMEVYMTRKSRTYSTKYSPEFRSFLERKRTIDTFNLSTEDLHAFVREGVQYARNPHDLLKLLGDAAPSDRSVLIKWILKHPDSDNGMKARAWRMESPDADITLPKEAQQRIAKRFGDKRDGEVGRRRKWSHR